MAVLSDYLHVHRNKCVFRCHLNVAVVLHSRVSAGSKFQMDDAATMKASRARSVLDRGRPSAEHRKTVKTVQACELAPGC